MSISVAPTSLFPLGEEPTRISVRINRDLLKLIDPSMVPLEEGDSFTRVGRKGRAAINQVTRVVSTALFGAEVSKLPMDFGWSKPGMGPDGPEIRAHHYVGVCFDHHVTKEVPDPRVLELTADEEIDGNVVFNAVEVDTARRDSINTCVSNAQPT
ncbi:hypothetical protein F5883DRAFT_583861 [Diaporthe sp. PMI_573]|nr:hypothetical protein F5883DRAFT_583861 [Diaporthaceae sp. PMI_573]